MNIDLKPLLRGDTRRFPFDVTEEAPEAAPGVTYAGEVRVTGEVTDEGDFLSVHYRVSVPYRTRCARCCRDLERVFEEKDERPVARSGELEDPDSADEYIIADKDDTLDLTPAVAETFLMYFPMVDLCREDCKGLCPTCGKDLNEGPCGCSSASPDPRWDILQKLLDK